MSAPTPPPLPKPTEQTFRPAKQSISELNNFGMFRSTASGAWRIVVALSFVACVASGLSAWAAGVPTASGQRVVLRGIGWSPWYPGTGWHRSAEVQAKDIELLRGAHINALRTWGAVSVEGAKSWDEKGFYLASQVSNGWWKKAGVPLSRFADGKDHRFPSFANPATTKAFVAACEAYAETTKGAPNVVLSLLGNEFSWVGQNRRNDHVYAGFDELTLTTYRKHLRRRFGDVANLNKLCGTDFADLDNVAPPGSGAIRYEWWLFLRQTFADCMRAGHEALNAKAPHLNTSYAKLMARWDPCCEDAALSFLDVGGQNLYWHWDKNWTRYVFLLKQVIRHARGSPVVITESGFRTMMDEEEEARSARRMKQMLWNCFLQPEVAGVFPFLFSDEWWVDGDDTSQSPGESWGIVTAHREPKRTYHSVAEVYAVIEQLGNFLVEARSSAKVAVSCQDLDWAFAPKTGGGRALAVAQALLSQGVEFRVVYGDDLLTLDPKTTPRLILCDSVLLRSPDGRRSAAKGLADYVKAGGRVLHLAPAAFRVSYPEAPMPDGARDLPAAVARADEGLFMFVPTDSLTPTTAWAQVESFVEPVRVVTQVRVAPPTRSLDVFVFPMRSGKQRLFGIVNEADEAVESVSLTLPPAAAQGTRLVAADGAALELLPDSGQVHLIGLNTYAILAE